MARDGGRPGRRLSGQRWNATRARPDGTNGSIPAAPEPHQSTGYEFLIERGIEPPQLSAAVADAALTGVWPHEILIASGLLDPQRYIDAVSRQMAPATTTFATDRDRPAIELIDALSEPPWAVLVQADAARARGNTPLLVNRAQLDLAEPAARRQDRVEQAARGFRKAFPALSAGSQFALWQVIAAPVMMGLTLGGLAVAPDTTLAVLAALVTLPFLLVVGLRLLSLIFLMQLRKPRRQGPRIPDAELPVYTVLVPLFREADVLPQIVSAIGNLDYPAAKLDVMLLLESVDAATQAAARQLTLPWNFRIIIVPNAEPRTKPKALNYALQVARGDYVVVYDAEDEPQPDQLRAAIAMFRRGPANLSCVQARLNIYNSGSNWLTRQFTLEYTALFDAVLPALVHFGVPVPLGGTSNHFPRSELMRLGGWDAYNVTEDADLGIRIARQGGRVMMLASTTLEEAPRSLSVWTRQRTRWLKGFMQTWLVHTRAPTRLLADLGPSGFLAFHAFLGGIILSALIHPIFVVLIIGNIAAGNLLVLPESTVASAFAILAGFNLLAGYISAMAVAAIATARRGAYGLILNVAIMPLYWLLISFAAYRALLQLLQNPYLWEKTPHTPRARPAQAAGRPTRRPDASRRVS